MTRKQHSDLYIAACETERNGGGVYRYRIEEGKLVFIDKKEMDRPMYLRAEGKLLYALLRAPFGESTESGLAIYQIEEDGRIGALLSLVGTKGVVACHHSVCGGETYAVNYLSGNVVHIGGETVTHEGKGPNEKRQDMPHTHCVIFSPDSRFLLVADLGLDTVFCYDRTLSLVSSAKVPLGDGARHLVFSADGKTLFSVNELRATLTRFAFSDGILTAEETVSCDVNYDEHPENLAAAIRLGNGGRTLYVSNRGEDTVCYFDAETLSLQGKIATGGKAPRDFELSPDESYLVSANMDSNTATLLPLEKGIPQEAVDSVSLPVPLCVVFA